MGVLDAADVLQRLTAAGGVSMGARFRGLDGLASHDPIETVADAPQRDTPVDFDVVLVGGGLSVLLAQALAQRGWRVAVYERAARIEAHRAWNASWSEIEALRESDLVPLSLLRSWLLAQYDHGICRWHQGSTTRVTGVLDCALDASALLAHACEQLHRHGAYIACDHEVGDVHANAHGVRLAVRSRHAPSWRQITARIVLDGRGVQSPFARHDLLCPTVGGVLEGLEEGSSGDPHSIDPRVGEILVTTDPVEAGRQHIWEAFPAGDGRVALYLFYYERARQRTPGALTQLYQRFFERLPSYKRGHAHLLTPTFGWIPGWSRLTRGPVTPHARVVLVGDAAARHSPLTFCGFGAMLRSIRPVTTAVHGFLAGNDAKLQAAVDDRAIHRATGALACIMAAPPEDPAEAHSINALLSSAFSALHGLGPQAYASLLQDTMPLGTFVRFLRQTSRLQPDVYRHVWRALGPWAASRWAAGLVAAMARQAPSDARDVVPT